MAIGAIIHVKDEVELLELNLQYHQKIGVDYFLICARDATRVSLSKIYDVASNENISVFEQNLYNLDTDSEAFKNRRTIAFRKIVDTFAPDWVMIIDTDEFWIPRSGNIRATQDLKNFDLLSVPRFNAALLQDTISILFEKIQDADKLIEQEIIVASIRLSRIIMKDHPNIPWIMHKIDPKFMTKVKDVAHIKPGFRDLISSSSVRRSIPNDLLILHIPFTTEDRFNKKIENMRIHLKNTVHTFDAEQAWHWRRWVDELQETITVHEEFNKQFFSLSLLQVFRASKVVMSINDYFETHT